MKDANDLSRSELDRLVKQAVAYGRRSTMPQPLDSHDNVVDMETCRPGAFDLDWRAPNLPAAELEIP